MSYYLDASIIVSIVVQEARSQRVADLLSTMEEAPIISDYGAGEVASAISRGVRIGATSVDLARSSLNQFDGWASALATVIEIDTRDIQRASQIVRLFDLNLRFPDALHMAICDNRGFALLTGDAQMAAAADNLRIDVTYIA